MEKFKRKKKFNIINSFFYFIDKILPVSDNLKLKIYLNLNFIFKRLAYEISYKKFQNHHPSTQNTINNIKRHIKKNYRILDIGCGNGYIAHSLSKFVKTVTCIDYDRKVIENAKQNFTNNNIEYICDDINNFNKFNLKKFDLIICSHIIEHLDKPFSFLKLLKKFDALIYIEVPDFETDNLNWVKKKIKFYLNYTDDDHIYEFNRNYLINKLKKNRFKIIKQNYQNGVISLLVK